MFEHSLAVLMDSGVNNAIMGVGSTAPGLDTFATDTYTQLGTVIPIGLAVAVTVVLVFKSIGWFKKLAGLRGRK